MKYVRRNFEPRNICYIGGGGGQTADTTTTHADTTTTSQTATGTVGTVNNIAAGATNTTSDYGAITAAGNVVQTAIAADQADFAKALDTGTATAANAINLINNTQTGAADLISKALGLAAATTGANSNIVNTLAGAVPNQTAPAVNPTLDVNTIVPVIAAGVAVYFIWKGKI